MTAGDVAGSVGATYSAMSESKHMPSNDLTEQSLIEMTNQLKEPLYLYEPLPSWLADRYRGYRLEWCDFAYQKFPWIIVDEFDYEGSRYQRLRCWDGRGRIDIVDGDKAFTVLHFPQGASDLLDEAMLRDCLRGLVP